MNTVILKETLHAALNATGRAVASRTTIPALSTILFEVSGAIKIAATNLTVGQVRRVGGKAGAPGALAVPARLLSDFIASLPNEPVHLEIDAHRRTLLLTCQRFESEIKGLDPVEFPAINEAAEQEAIASFGAAALKEAIEQVVFAVAVKEEMPAMTGVNLVLAKGQARLVAADGLRMATRTLPATTGPGYRDLSVIVPAKAMIEVARMGDEAGVDEIEVTLTASGNQIVFRASGNPPPALLTSALIEARYPDCDPLIPRAYESRVVVATASFLQAARVAKLFSTGDSHIIRLATLRGEGGPDGLVIHSKSAEIGRGSITTDALIEGPEAAIAFNDDYLIGALAAIATPEVALEVTGPERPGVIRPVGRDDHLNVLMPMQLGG